MSCNNPYRALPASRMEKQRLNCAAGLLRQVTVEGNSCMTLMGSFFSKISLQILEVESLSASYLAS